MTSSFSIYTVLGLLISILLPTAMLIWWKRKHSSLGLWPFIAGAICYIAFAKLLYTIITNTIEELLYLFCDVSYSALYSAPILYALIAGLTVGLFEETGRLFAFRFLLRRCNTPDVAVAYGIGSGGMNILIVLGLGYGIFFAQASEFSNKIFEVIPCMAAHIGLSMLVFKAANDRRKFCLYPVAILLHALLVFPLNYYSAALFGSSWTSDISAFYNLWLPSKVGTIVFAAAISAGILYLGIRALYSKKNENIEQENEADDYQ